MLSDMPSFNRRKYNLSFAKSKELEVLLSLSLGAPRSSLSQGFLSKWFWEVRPRNTAREQEDRQRRKPDNQGYRVWLKSVGKEVAQCLCVPTQIYI